MTCNDCPYHKNCQIWFANGVPFSCRGLREGLIDDSDDEEASDGTDNQG